MRLKSAHIRHFKRFVDLTIATYPPMRNSLSSSGRTVAANPRCSMHSRGTSRLISFTV